MIGSSPSLILLPSPSLGEYCDMYGERGEGEGEGEGRGETHLDMRLRRKSTLKILCLKFEIQPQNLISYFDEYNNDNTLQLE